MNKALTFLSKFMNLFYSFVGPLEKEMDQTMLGPESNE